MNRDTALKNAKKLVDFLAGEGLTTREATEAFTMAKVIFVKMRDAAIEKQENTALADIAEITRAAEISLEGRSSKSEPEI